jgi:hypothetical protein
MEFLCDAKEVYVMEEDGNLYLMEDVDYMGLTGYVKSYRVLGINTNKLTLFKLTLVDKRQGIYCEPDLLPHQFQF